MRAALQRWRALTIGDRSRLLGLLLLLPMVSTSLKLFGYRRSLALAERLSRHRSPRSASGADLERAETLARLAAIAGRRGMVQATCLRQALAVYLLLRRRGLAPALKLGVDRQGSQPDMHAWVELDGQALGQTEVRHASFEATASARQADTFSTSSGKRP